MTLHDVDRIYKGWAKLPPLRLLVMQIGAALGVKYNLPKPTPIEKSQYMTADDMRRMMAATGGRIEGVAAMGGVHG